MRIVITGAAGLLGYHTAARVHAMNCAAQFSGADTPYDLVQVDRAGFNDDAYLIHALTRADAVIHFAAVNRASAGEDMATANPAIAHRLVDMCKQAKASPHIVYANSTHAAGDSVYGVSKAQAGHILADFAPHYTNLILPHIFGEGSRPFYNNVTATLIAQILAGDRPTINSNGHVQLLHAGLAAKIALDAIVKLQTGDINPPHTPMVIPDLYAKLSTFHDLYTANIYPDIQNDFDLALFNTYRTPTYPAGWPRGLTVHADARGTLFEATKGGGGGQVFLSTSKPGVVRGDHFHLHKAERFLVLQGLARIRVRKVFSDKVWTYDVSGDTPVTVDMPTLHTHSIENIGDTPMLALFWTNALFDPEHPDTYAEKVLL